MIPLTTTNQVVTGAAQVVGLAVLAATIAAMITVGYRWYTRERIPVGLALLAGLAGVAVYVSATATLEEVIGGETSALRAALYNIVAFVVSGGGAVGGHRFGDGFARDVLFRDPVSEAEQNVSELVETVGRVTVVDLPERIEDVVGYDAVSAETREALGGKRFVFPQRLTRTEIDERLRARIRADYGVGTVDLELAPDGTVEYIAVGSKAAGIGPTLPPATNAVALRADPAFDASTGDIVQVWEADSMRRVLTGELRGVSGDIVTVAINSADTPKVDPTREYRLVTLPVEDRPAREFASLLRAADESFASVTVEAGSPLHGMPVGALQTTIVSVRPEDREPVALPSREYVLAPGELVFAIGTPTLLRKLERATAPLDPSVVSTTTERRATPETEATETTDDTEQVAFDASADETGEQTLPTDSSADEATQSGPRESVDSADPGEQRDDSPSTPDPTDSGQSAPPTAGKADQSSFEELKAEYESGADWEEDEADDSEDDSDAQPIEELAEDGDDGDEATDGSASFDELKAEFESGDATWSDDAVDEPTTDDTLDENDDGSEGSSFEDGNDDLVSLDEADISFGEDAEEESDDGLEAAGFDDDIDDESDLGDGFDTDGFEDDSGGLDDGLNGSDDLSSLDVDEAEDLSELDADKSDGDGLFDDDPFSNDSLFEEGEESLAEEAENQAQESEDEQEGDGEDDEEDDDEESADDSDDSDDSDDDSGGGTSFAQLKEEFESGDADWEDDVSDSPGGDMRLDE